MTELKDVDSLLRDSFARIAEPGDPAGVVDSIRTRMDAGDTGTPADSSGFGSGSGIGSWLPWGAMVVVAGLVGAGLGLSGVVGAPAAEVVQLTVLAVDATTDAYDCPGGAAVSTFSANERALVVARTQDSQWLGVRDSYDYSHTVWLPASVVSVDSGQGDVDAVPVQDCVVPEVVVNTPTPVATIDPEKPTPGGPTDHVAPAIFKISAVPTIIYNNDQTVVEVQASDNNAVTGVNIVISGAYSGTRTMTKVGNVWQLSFSITEDNYYGDITFTARAVDAAGNQSAPASVVVDHQYFG